MDETEAGQNLMGEKRHTAGEMKDSLGLQLDERKMAPPASRKRRIFTADVLHRTHEQSAHTSIDIEAKNQKQDSTSPGVDAATRDWHVEILSGLFLRSSEQELNWLEDEVQKNQLDRREQSEAEVSLHDIDSFDTISRLEERGADDSNSSILPLIPWALRGMCPTSNKKDKDEFDRPLLIPKSWRRPTYESLTLSELEQKMYSKRRKTITESDRDEDGCKMVPILYNECSLSALANWAMMDPPDSAVEVTPLQSPSHHDEDWERYTRELTQKMATVSTSYETPMPSCTFRKCGVCEKFGHYEVECELLLDLDNSSQLTDQQQVSNDGHVKSQTQVPLDEEIRKSIVSDLAKEIRNQQLLRDVIEECRRENETKSPQYLKSIEDEVIVKKDVGELDNHVGRSTKCAVCKSGLLDQAMLMCDGCDELFHLSCLDPPLESIPEGEWLCDDCVSYDSDESSVVVIEGCQDFVVEQRKRSCAESSQQFSGVSLGQHKCQWTAALSVVNESEPAADDAYLRDHVADGYHQPNFILGKLCWAKRFCEQLDCPIWWPAMIVEPNKKTMSMQAMGDVFTVRFFCLNKKKNVFASGLLPFLPYYEDIGYSRLGNCVHVAFQNALQKSISVLGLKTFGQALKVARSGIQKSLDTTSHDTNFAHEQLKAIGWRPPVGWESAIVEEVDDFVILSKERSTAKKIAAGENEKVSASDQTSIPDQNDIHLNLSLSEVVGSLVSWRTEGRKNTVGSESTHYGTVLSINHANKMALIRALQTDRALEEDLRSNSCAIYTQDVGGTLWMPLSQIRFVASKPDGNSLVDFKAALKSRMNKEMNMYKSQCEALAVEREENTVELHFNDKLSSMRNWHEAVVVTAPEASDNAHAAFDS
jgi:hypothetical protein